MAEDRYRIHRTYFDTGLHQNSAIFTVGEAVGADDAADEKVDREEKLFSISDPVKILATAENTMAVSELRTMRTSIAPAVIPIT